MSLLLTLISLLASLVALVCWIIILVSAFQDEVWKGVVGLLCGLYLLYWGIFEFEHEYKLPLLGGWLAGGGLATALSRMAMHH